MLTSNNEPRHRRVRRDLAGRCSTRSSRSRTSASTRTAASTCAASGARSSRTSSSARRSRAARRSPSSSSRTRSQAQDRAHDLPEAARGRARLPPHAQVVEGEDPHRVPQLDLLRQRRLRDRVGGAHVLRQRSTTAAARGGRRCAQRADARRGGAARRRRRLAERVRPGRAPRRPRRRGATSCSCACASRATSRRPSTSAGSQEALPATTDDPPAAPWARTARAATSRRWVRQQLVDRFGARRAFEGGLRIRTTLDLELQQAAEAVGQRVARRPRRAARRRSSRSTTTPARSGRWSAARDYTTRPFNLATQGQRQPGSAFKPFVLATALRSAASRRARSGSSQEADVHRAGDERQRSSSSTTTRTPTSAPRRWRARRRSPTTPSTPQVGIKIGTRQVARTAQAAWASARRSRRNSAMTLGGLKQGVTAARHGPRLRDVRDRRPARHRARSAPAKRGPVGIRKVDACATAKTDVRRHEPARAHAACIPAARRRRRRRASSQSVVTSRHRRSARASASIAAGKTGTTENYGDAWFVGFTDRMTVAVWVGYPDRLKPMETEFRGEPVAGRHVPGADLARLHGRRATICRDTQARGACARRGRQARPSDEPRRADRADARRRRRPAPRRATATTRAPPATPRHRHDDQASPDGGARRADDATPDAEAPPRRRPRRRRSRRRRRRPPAPPTPQTPRRPRRRGAEPRAARRPAAGRRRSGGRAGPGGHGRETCGCPRAQKRHGSSTALRDPDARPGDEPRPLAAARRRAEPDRAVAQRSSSLWSSPMPSACVSLPGPSRGRRGRGAPAALAHASSPSSGSSARISTAAPTPSGSQTALSSAWMP